jgi:hypothetical protein
MVPDALVGLSVFVLILMLTFGNESIAAPSFSAADLMSGTLVAEAGGRQGSLVLLAAAFATLVALDLAFFRHVVRTYALLPGTGRRAGRRSRLDQGS